MAIEMAESGEDVNSIERSVSAERYLNDKAWSKELFQMAVLKSRQTSRPEGW